MNKYLKNRGNYEVLQIKLGDLLLLFIYWRFMGSPLHGAAMILYANLAFSCIDRFIPTVASLF